MENQILKTNNLIYLCGAKNGKTDSIDRFLNAKKLLSECGYDVRLPKRVRICILPLEIAAETLDIQLKLDEFPKSEAADYITTDLLCIMACASIYMLKDWEYDIFANREFGFALALRKNIIFEGAKLERLT